MGDATYAVELQFANQSLETALVFFCATTRKASEEKVFICTSSLEVPTEMLTLSRGMAERGRDAKIVSSDTLMSASLARRALSSDVDSPGALILAERHNDQQTIMAYDILFVNAVGGMLCANAFDTTYAFGADAIGMTSYGKSSDVEGTSIETSDPRFATDAFRANPFDSAEYGNSADVEGVGIERGARLRLVELLERSAAVRFLKLVSVVFGLNHLCLVARRRLADRVFPKRAPSRTTGAERK